ncbi:DUF4064 domain-containing protein [Nosocomiicoccus ampullae]|uniref:DUF4064 domain-containing protein n=1 Tax=Nosocomiicoccus ampullae TaxID=489910 RepID=UPI00254A5FAF|nr:DUF4064 domain-containing protein [Nosocomiicoccus ampullae]MDK6863393.1 DUF4064 domain-containing protein [Nosocomiicoccus ampullae]
MAKRDYTVRVEPISRVPEKIIGWIGWIALLAVVLLIAYVSYAIGNDPQFMNIIEEEARRAAVEEGVNPQEVTDLLVGMLSKLWLLSLIGVIPLIISFIGLVKMKKRILAGSLLLITAIIIAPFVVTLFSSLMFVIAAVLLFVRKDKETIINDYNESHAGPSYEDDTRVAKRPETRPVPVVTEDEDLEKTRMFTAVDEDDYKDISYDEDLSPLDDVDNDAKRTRRENLDKRNEE